MKREKETVLPLPVSTSAREGKKTQPLFAPTINFSMDYSLKEETLNSSEELAALYTKEPRKEIITGMHNNGKMMPKSERTYQIHTINSLPALVNTLKSNYKAAVEKAGKKGQEISAEKNEKLHTIRYLLIPNDELLFAVEGSEPAHFVMTGETEKSSASACRCAGNLRYNDDFTKFIFINNKSGDFSPEDVLLRQPLGVFGTLSEQGLLAFEDTVQIEHQRARMTYNVSLNHLQEFSQTFSAERRQHFVTVNQQAQHREVNYMPKQQGRRTLRRDDEFFGFQAGSDAKTAPPPTPRRSGGRSRSGRSLNFNRTRMSSLLSQRGGLFSEEPESPPSAQTAKDQEVDAGLLQFQSMPSYFMQGGKQPESPPFQIKSNKRRRHTTISNSNSFVEEKHEKQRELSRRRLDSSQRGGAEKQHEVDDDDQRQLSQLQF